MARNGSTGPPRADTIGERVDHRGRKSRRSQKPWVSGSGRQEREREYGRRLVIDAAVWQAHRTGLPSWEELALRFVPSYNWLEDLNLVGFEPQFDSDVEMRERRGRREGNRGRT